ncbi:hypothetical protein GQX60_07210 [Brachyspira hyodysenteriae]|uniref:hypothetical protein n=1 Tax=Brachyspira hyodysenteriae TaxID=159 RepID=UPI001ADDA151|nr:hypothetical protein [Brachyspira hyodysenteriae]QTM08667.1 hypothetical protein GQX60_07210 [Brachyspira hyodysenteriae]
MSDFYLNINETLKLNGALNVKENYFIDEKLDEESIKKFIFTNDFITNYSYSFRIKYYDKVFRNSDIYDVYLNTNKIFKDNYFIKEIEMNQNGSPFGKLISDTIIKVEKIDNIKYKLSIKKDLHLYFIIILISILMLIFLVLCAIYILKIILKKRINIINDVKKCLYIKSNINSNNTHILILILFFPFIFLFYEYIYSSTPYYFTADSSHIYSMDILLVSSNMFPEHLLHPNTIPLLLFKYIFIPVGKFFGIISISNVNELKNSLNPYLSFVEFTEYILNICRISFLMSITFMYINIIKIIRKYYEDNKILFSILCISILIIFSFSKFIFNASIIFLSVIRYENIGLLLVSLSLYFIILSSETNDCTSIRHLLYLIISSIFIGAAVLSKIVIAGWTIGIFLIYIILNLDKYYKYKDNDNISLNNILNILIITTILLVYFNILVFMSFRNHILPNMAYLYDISKNKLLILQMLTPAFFVILSIITYLIQLDIIKINYSLKLLLKNFIIYVLFCLYTLLLSLFLPDGIVSFFVTYIFSYAGGSMLVFEANSSYGQATKNALIYLNIIIVFAIFIFFTLMKIRKLIMKNFSILNISINIILLIFSVVFLKTIRKNANDLIISLSLLITSIFLFIQNTFYFIKNKKIIYILPIILLCISLFILVNLKNYTNINIYDKNLSHSLYDFNSWRKDAIDIKNGIIFSDIITNTYQSKESWDSVSYWSIKVKELRKLIKQVDITNNSLNDTVIANKNVLLSKNTKERIYSIDDDIKGGIILTLRDNTNNVYPRLDYDFYFISDINYKKNDNRMILMDYDFSINEEKYFVYKLDINNLREKSKLSNNIELNAHFQFIKNEDFNKGFILINDRLAKGL